MSEIGKAVRLSRILNPESGHIVNLALDHGPALGPVPGIVDPVATVRTVCQAKPDAIFTNRGIIKKTYSILSQYQVPFMLSVSAIVFMGEFEPMVDLVAGVEEAVSLGACGVSIHVLVGVPGTLAMVKNLAQVARECDRWGMPLMAIMYPFGLDNIYDVKYVKHAARIAVELGADVVKTYYTGDPESFSEVVSGCPVPLLMSGGPKAETCLDFLRMLKGAMDGGASGVAVGRNVWQHHNPIAVLSAVKRIVHAGASPEEAVAGLGIQ